MTNPFIRLTSSEIVEGRPFTDVEGSYADRATLEYMANRLGWLLRQPTAIPTQPRPVVLFLEEPDHPLHRIALARPEALVRPADLTVVGFCGQKRAGADRGRIETLDRKLIAEFSLYDDLLSYSTLQMMDGNACNLVLFSQPQGIGHWATSKTHARAVQLSPDYYECIRLHHGHLPGGLMSANKLVLLRTKYYDYRHQPVWRAIRELSDHGQGDHHLSKEQLI